MRVFVHLVVKVILYFLQNTLVILCEVKEEFVSNFLSSYDLYDKPKWNFIKYCIV